MIRGPCVGNGPPSTYRTPETVQKWGNGWTRVGLDRSLWAKKLNLKTKNMYVIRNLHMQHAVNWDHHLSVFVPFDGAGDTSLPRNSVQEGLPKDLYAGHAAMLIFSHALIFLDADNLSLIKSFCQLEIVPPLIRTNPHPPHHKVTIEVRMSKSPNIDPL